VKNSVAMFPGTKANSSRKTILKEPERAADDDVEEATITEPFSIYRSFFCKIIKKQVA
jgi:hypothetical protein